MLSARDLWFGFERGSWVLQGINIDVSPGEVVGLVGPSGRGKTTLARVLSGYLPPSRGAVHVDGQEIPSRGVRPVQLVFQHPELAVDPRWRLSEVLTEPLAGDGGRGRGASKVDTELLDELSVARGWLDRYPAELSGGELQRIVVARALCSGAPYLIADEISAMLDPITQAQIWHVLLKRAMERNLGILAIAHDRALLGAVAHRVVDLDEMTPGPEQPEL